MAGVDQIMPTPLSALEPEWCTVGCPRLDDFLQGGLLCRSITELAGEFASGKTQFCMQCCLAVQWPVSSGGLNGKAVYICTEGMPAGERIEEMAMEHWRMGKGAGEGSLDGILIIEAVCVQALWICLNQVANLVAGGDSQVRLVVIDSIANLFREVSDKPSIDELKERANRMFEMSSLLKKMADECNLAVLITNQVVDVISNDGQPSESGMSEVQTSGREVLPSLGLAWASCINTRLVATRHVNGDVRIRDLQVAFSPHLNQSRCLYEISKAGLFGIPEAIGVQSNIQ
ncbi:hypothetical protein BSKO_10735 [Bryopsis sp. KO-2023]|nr:hypothetical protein BSKO_10735 [Bryopsis sp. KO-2023]